MTNYVYTFKTIVAKAESIKKNVETEYKLGESTGWSYYIAKAILTKKDVVKITVKGADKSTGNDFSRQILKDEYKDMANRLVKFVENNSKLPNYITINNKKMRVSDYCYMFARILAYLDKNGKYPNQANVNSKAFTKPTEYPTEILKYFEKKTGIKLKQIDDFCDWCKNKVTYEFYFDDKKSNKEVIDSKAGNCVDLSQLAVNIAEALNYEWVIYHVKCNQSGTGHVYPMFRKSNVNNGKYFARDVACIADESRYCVWCESGNGGSLIAKNPAWWLSNLNR